MDDAVDPSDPRLRGIRPSEIPTTKALRMGSEDDRPLALFDNVMPATPSGKIELVSDVLAKKWGAAARTPAFRPREGRFPLSLVSPASDERISSTLLGAGGGVGDRPAVADASARRRRARGLAAATRVKVWNDLGAVILSLQVSDAIRPGVVSSEKGAWLATSSTAQTISALVSADQKADLAEGACFNDTGVEVEAA